MSLAFDNSAPVATVEFQYPDAADDVDIAQREAVVRLIQRLTDGQTDPSTIGRQVLILSAVLRIRTQKDVAELLGVTEAAVSKAVKLFRKDFLRKTLDSDFSG